MITIPLYLAVAQWVLLAALGLLVIVMFRQLGRLLSGTGGAPPELGPPVGGRAKPLAYVRPGEAELRQWTPGAGQPALVAFVDPTCPSCEVLVSLLETARATGQLAGIRTLLLISDPPGYLAISEPFRLTKLEIGRPSEPAGLDFSRVTGTPLLVAVDGEGIVRAAGPAHQATELLAFVTACRPAPAGPARPPGRPAALTGEGQR